MTPTFEQTKKPAASFLSTGRNRAVPTSKSMSPHSHAAFDMSKIPKTCAELNR